MLPRSTVIRGVAVLWWVALPCGCRHAEAPPPASGELFTAMATEPRAATSDAELWTRAVAARNFEFPQDHGSHEDYRIEWWYYTGNLKTTKGRRFGYQLTFFRTGLHREPQTASRWSVRNLYTAHFAISDLNRQQHIQAQRNNRGALGQAGADVGELHVWNGNWHVVMEGEVHKLTAERDGDRIELRLTPGKPLTAHGQRGLSRKGAAQGNASYYYSFTNMATQGTVTCGGRTWQVTGKSWMDHEFSTSFLEPGQLGWDWFSIQLDNDNELMLYRMRRNDGSSDPYSSGTFIDARGKATHLTLADFELLPKSRWKSPHSAGEYPLSWRIHVPQLDCELDVDCACEDQEMRTADTTGITYWEGSIVVSGTLRGSPVSGTGYLELTGYAGRGLGSLP